MVELPDEEFDAATAVMGCAPAYLALAVEAIADAGAQAGLDADLARELVVETTAGTAELLRLRHPADVRKAVASPGGSTEAGLEALDREGVREGVRGGCAGLAGEDARMIALALTRADVADYVNALFIVYIILIFANILISWLPRVPYNRWLRAVLDFVTETTNPYLNLFRRFLPPIGGGGFALDLSPMIGVIVLLVLRRRRRRPDRRVSGAGARAWRLAGALCGAGRRRRPGAPRRASKRTSSPGQHIGRAGAAEPDPRRTTAASPSGWRAGEGHGARPAHVGGARLRRRPLRRATHAARDVGRRRAAGRGALGNLADRVRVGRGHRLHRACRTGRPSTSPTSAITVGVVLLALAYLREPRAE